MENIEHLLNKFKEETAIPSIVLTTERRSDMAITDSKLGGNPYLPKNFAYPTSPKGEPLKLLAQLNFAQLPVLANFPTDGILQFFVLPDETVGMNDYPQIRQNTFRVVYHKEIETDENIMTDFPEIKWIAAHDGAEIAEELYPFTGEFLLKGQIMPCAMPYSTYEFDNMFAAFCKNQNIESYFKPYFMDWEKMKKSMTKSEFKEFDREQRRLEDLVWGTFSGDEAHRIGGYPYFVQNDPRSWGEPALKKYDTLLFSVASEYNTDKERKLIDMGMVDDEIKPIGDGNEIMWGDAGVANFLINADDLKNLNFLDVLYTWDCG